MAISTYNTELHYCATKEGTYEMLAPVKNIPDLFGDPNQLETTTLSDPMQTFIAGIKQTSTLQFTMNWEPAIAKKIQEMEGKTGYWKVILSDGTTFAFDGQPSLGIPSKGVDEVIEINCNIIVSSAIEMTIEE